MKTQKESPREALAQRLYMSDPEQGQGHGAWDMDDVLSEELKDRYREFAKNLLQPCDRCPQIPLISVHDVADMLTVSVPEPDATNPDHGNFVYDWLGQVTDLDLAGGQRSVELYSPVDVGDFVRGRVLDLIDRLEAKQKSASDREQLVSVIATGMASAGSALAFLGIHLGDVNWDDLARSVVENPEFTELLNARDT